VEREDIPLAVSAMEKARRTGQSTRLECRFRRKSGGTLWVEALLTPIRDPVTGDLIGFSDVIRDITDRRKLEDSLRTATVMAEQAVKVKSEFMANMTHELRTPLTSILGFGALLANARDLSPESRRYVSRVVAASSSLLTTVNDILDFSRLEAGQVEIRRRPVDVTALIQDTADLLRPQADEKDLALDVIVDDGIPPLAVDPDRLRQVLLNLIGNAVKFTRIGRITVHAHYETAQSTLTIAIEDTGPGIPADQLQSIFQRFVRAKQAAGAAAEGSGLGLAIASGLLRLMDGTIDVDSTLGVGSRFQCRIAADPAQLDVLDDTPQRDSPALRVLVVDDHAANRDLVRVILDPLGWAVDEAVDGLSGVERCASTAYDVVLMDYRMPGMTGLDALQAIRQRPGPNQFVPVIAFTANASGEDAQRLLKQGFDGFAGKPILPADLLAAIIDTVNGASGNRQIYG
jgi:signal transduction histidine kinase/ActR/RegA family two-component response regulator